MTAAALPKRIKQYALYGDTDAESYKCVKERIEEANRRTSKIFSVVALVLTFIMFLLSFTTEGLVNSRYVYLSGSGVSVILIFFAFFPKKAPIITYLSVYTMFYGFMLFSIVLATVTRVNSQAVSFIVLIIFVPLIWTDRPIRMAIGQVLSVVAFIIVASHTKSGELLSVDITDSVIYGTLSVVSMFVVYRAKIRGYVFEHKLHIMSETDQLTGLNNRNCYELRIDAYKSMYKNSICCVYIDVNGLHELNNTRGHKLGDEMLCSIADIVKNLFGTKDTYRVGGDEYVAFALDVPEEEIKKRIHEMNLRITERDYHAAVGYELCDDKDADINKLIVSAESKMYRDKAEYYKKNERSSR